MSQTIERKAGAGNRFARAGGGWRRLVLMGTLAATLAGCQPRATPESDIVLAVRKNDVQTVRTWLQAGGDPNQKSREGDPLLYIASGAVGGPGVARALIEAGADVSGRGATGRTPLENAAGWCDVAAVGLLLGAGAQRGPLANPDQASKIVCQQPLDRRARVFALLGIADPLL